MATAVNAAGSRARSAFLPSTCVCYRVAACVLLREDRADGSRVDGVDSPRHHADAATEEPSDAEVQKDAAQRTSSNLSQACLSNLRKARLSGSSAHTPLKILDGQRIFPALVPRHASPLTRFVIRRINFESTGAVVLGPLQ